MRCCVACRLLGKSSTCPVCGAQMVELRARQEELLEPPETKVHVEKAKPSFWRLAVLYGLPPIVFFGLVLGLVALHASGRVQVDEDNAQPILVGLLAVATAIALAIALTRFVRRQRTEQPKRMSTVAVDPSDFAASTNVSEHVGVARKLSSYATSVGDRGPCLASTVVFRRGDDVVVWQRDAVEFLLERDDGTTIVVSTDIWLDLPRFRHGTDTGAGQSIRTRLPVFPSWELDANIDSYTLAEGSRIRVTGSITRERRPELAAGYRDAGDVEVIRGRPRALAVVTLAE